MAVFVVSTAQHLAVGLFLLIAIYDHNDVCCPEVLGSFWPYSVIGVGGGGVWGGGSE